LAHSGVFVIEIKRRFIRFVRKSWQTLSQEARANQFLIVRKKHFPGLPMRLRIGRSHRPVCDAPQEMRKAECRMQNEEASAFSNSPLLGKNKVE